MTTNNSIELNIAEIDSSSSPTNDDNQITINLGEFVARGLESSYLKFAHDIVFRLATIHGFDAIQALQTIGVHTSVAIEIIHDSTHTPKTKIVKPAKIPTTPKIKLPKEPKVKAEHAPVPLKPTFPLPFSGSINDSTCYGLCFAEGLFIQCSNKKSNGDFCKRCFTDADKNQGIPSHGTIQQRLDNIFDFTAPNGKKQVPYHKLMHKLQLTTQQINDEATRIGASFDPAHLIDNSTQEQPPKTKKTRAIAAAKKISSSSHAIIAGEVDDIFAGITAEITSATSTTTTPTPLPKKNIKNKQNNNSTHTHTPTITTPDITTQPITTQPITTQPITTPTTQPIITITPDKKKKNNKIINNETADAADALKKNAKEAADALKKNDKDAADALKKNAKEAADAQKKAKKEAADAQKKADKEAADAQKKAKVDSPKIKDTKKTTKETPLPTPPTPTPPTTDDNELQEENDDDDDDEDEDDEDDEDEDEDELVVTKKTIAGVQYLISKENDVYHPTSMELIGTYSPAHNTVTLL